MKITHIRRQPILLSLFLLSGLWSTGCTKYEYDVIAPPELAQPVGTKNWAVMDYDSLQYRLLTVDNRLVMQIHNPTNASIQLQGDKSVVVDPQGQSHALRSQTIAPASFIKLILPPMPNRVERSGPSFGFGLGLGIGSAGYGRHRGFGGAYGGYWNDPFYDAPRYYSVVDPNDSTYWEWDGEGNIRLTIVYDQAGKPLTHMFTIGRRKV
jgi:hypothetical protein